MKTALKTVLYIVVGFVGLTVIGPIIKLKIFGSGGAETDQFLNMLVSIGTAVIAVFLVKRFISPKIFR